jgi:prepilin-type processing-associated H-X9-DG protein
MEMDKPVKARCFRQPEKLVARANAFTRIDLLAVVFTVIFLGACFGMTHSGENGRIARCAGNLSAFGKAIHNYASEHDDAIPAAGINLGQTQTSWDQKISPYLKSVSRFYFCPSDMAPHKGTPCSYAMAGNDMSPENWPPGRDSATGVGLWWDEQTVISLLGNEALKNPESLPSIKLSDVPVPSDTLLMTELIDPNNNRRTARQVTDAGSQQKKTRARDAGFTVRQVSVFGTSQQQEFFKDGGAQFHHGRFNYLMVDGHVESFSPLQTGSFDGSAGIWTLKKQD